MTLLEKAKAHNVKRTRQNLDITAEHVELAIAWIRGDITYAQVASADNKVDARNVYVMLARALKMAYSERKLRMGEDWGDAKTNSKEEARTKV